MHFTFTVEIDLERDEGKFASRDELRDQIEDMLVSADAGTWEGDAGGVYSTYDWSVEEIEQPKRKTKRTVASVSRPADQSRSAQVADEAMERETREQERDMRIPYPMFCRQRDVCVGLSSCPLNPSCAD